MWFSGSRLFPKTCCLGMKLLTTVYCNQIIHTFNQCTYWCCRNLVPTVITKLQNSWKFPLKLPFFANLQVLNWFFIVTGIPEDIQVSPCGSAWGMSNVTEGKQSALRRVLELLSLMPVHYIYDSNQQVWRQVEEGVGDWVIVWGIQRKGTRRSYIQGFWCAIMFRPTMFRPTCVIE